MKAITLYRKGTMIPLLESDTITAFTKKILIDRLNEQQAAPLFFSQQQFNILTILCDLLMAQNPSERICNPAIAIDKRLACNNTNGWRYDTMPEDTIAYKSALDGIEAGAIEKYKKSFLVLFKYQRLHIMAMLQSGLLKKDIWLTIPSNIFFEELLAEVTAIFYSHPLAMEEIGFTGMADAKGWDNIGLNEKDLIEQDL